MAISRNSTQSSRQVAVENNQIVLELVAGRLSPMSRRLLDGMSWTEKQELYDKAELMKAQYRASRTGGDADWAGRNH